VNRSILIVICDFLVSSMLSMMTGMVPANTSGNSIGLDNESTRVLIVELERSRSELLKLRNALRENIERNGATPENLAKMDELNKQLAHNELKLEELQTLKNETPENTGILSREELAQRLEAERLRRIEAETREREKNESIAIVRDMLKETQGALQQSRESEAKLRYDVNRINASLAQTTQENAKKTEALIRTQTTLTQTEKALADSRQNLTQTQAALDQSKTQATRLETELNASRKSAAENRAAAEKSQTELTQTQTTLAHTQQALKETQGQVQLTLRRSAQSEEELNRLRGQNAATARELAEMKDKASKLERELEQQKVLRRDTEIAKGNAESFSKATTIELAEKGAAAKKAEAALADTQKKLIESEAEKNAVQQELQFLQKQTGTDLFAHYQNSVVKLGIEIVEERIVKDFGTNSVHYLPLVKIGQKNYLIGALPMFAGGEDKPYHYQKVTKLAYILAGGKVAQMTIGLPLLVSKKEPYLAAFELPALDGVTPLQCVPADKLRQRGVQRLTLFKTATCGKDSTPLGDRCSLDLQPGSTALIIRNNARNANEIKAQVGDFILTNDGEFVGVVVSVSDAGRYQEARVALGDAAWQDAEKVSLDVDITSRYYQKFGDYMKQHIKR